MSEPAAFARRERFGVVASTNDVVRSWLEAGVPEICLAIADVQTEGRGRAGRRWEAPTGAALLLSLGFRPDWLPAERVWRLAATTSLAMADAAEDTAGLPDGTIRLKWPNDLVVELAGPRSRPGPEADAAATRALSTGPIELRKLGGVLGESDGLGTGDPRVVVGIGIDVDWPADDFPAELRSSMTSLREVSGGRPVDRDDLLERFEDRLEVRVAALRAGFFDVGSWVERQATTGREVGLLDATGEAVVVQAVGVDALSGALLVADAGADPADEGRPVYAGEVTSVRLATPRVEV